MVETRFNSMSGVETENRRVQGYGAVFNSESQVLCEEFNGEPRFFIEIIHPEAITPELIQRSDILCRFNHSDEKVLARSHYGSGSLSLEVDERGLKYSFESPKTSLGDELLEYLQRGDVFASSFCFSLKNGDPSYERFSQGEDGILRRDIYKIDYLYDVAPVWNPAYPATEVYNRYFELQDKVNSELENLKEQLPEGENRGMEIIARCKKELRMLTPEEMKEFELLKAKLEEDSKNLQEVKEAIDPEKENEKTPEEPIEEPKETPAEEPKEEKADYETPKEEEDPEEKEITGDINCDIEDETAEEIEKPQQRFINNKNKQTTMNFSLTKALKAIAEGRSMDDAALAINEAGTMELRKAGLNGGASLVIPSVESRDTVSVANEGQNVVVTDFENILDPLRGNTVLTAAGAKVYSGLVGDVQLPILNPGNVSWEGENAVADDATYSTSMVKLSPKRITAFVPVSLQMLAQDSVGIEAAIRNDIMKAIAEKVEATILSDNDGTAGPKGMFYNVTPTSVTNFASLTGVEAAVEAANVMGACKYIVTPSAKAALRNLPMSAKTTRLVMENGEIDGTPAYVSTLLKDTTNSANILYGDFSNLAIGQWGGVQLDVVRDSASLKYGMVNIIVNAYFDAKVIRPVAFAAAKI